MSKFTCPKSQSALSISNFFFNNDIFNNADISFKNGDRK